MDYGKLIKLLNEYEYDKRREKTLRGMTNGCLYYIQSINSYLNLKIISKEYGFIKWLVDNHKIDFSRDGEYCTKSIEEFDGLLRDNEDGLIMILAISSSPIDDLISYLR